MKRAFTLVELIVSVVIVMLISGGALVYLNEFNSRQKLEKGKDEVVAAIKMIQSSAGGRQLPLNSTKSELNFIRLYTPLLDTPPKRYLKADVNEDGNDIFYRKSVNELGVGVSTIPNYIYFGAGNGRLIKDISLTPYLYYSDTETATVIVENEAEKIEGYEIIIDALGQIKEVNYYKE